MESEGFLGIDVSKGYADFVLLDANGKKLEDGFQLLDTQAGRQQLSGLIELWKSRGQKKLYCGVESTGGYENNWYSFLKGFQSRGGVFVSRLNAKAVKSVSDAIMRRTITDAVSAENIASYLAKFPEKVDYCVNYESLSGFTEGRHHLTCIRMHQKQKTQSSNQLEKLLYSYFPEMLVYCRRGTPLWLLKMLTKYPTASAVIKGGKRLSKIKGITEQKAQALISKAKENEGRIVSEQIAHIISVTASEVLHKETIINTEKAYLYSIYKDGLEPQLLQSIKGVGIESAVLSALIIEDANRFDSVKKMSSYFGVHPTYKQSGDGKWGSHMSKKGKGEIRNILYMCAVTAARCNAVLKPVYAKCRAKGMNHYQAIGVVMHKLLRIMYGVLKSRKPFNPETDIANQQRSKEKQASKEENEKAEKKVAEQKKYRFQSLTEDGPVSARNAKKRKKQIASQASMNEENTGLLSASTNI